MRSSLKTAIAAGVACVVMSLAFVAQAGASQIVEFEPAAAVEANGTIPPVPAKPLEEVKEVCGSETATWGSELLTTAPGAIKVPNEWGDIVPGKEMEISGTITKVVYSNFDLPIDHPFSTDFTFNVKLDEPYWSLARQLGPGESEGAEGNESETHEIHVELESGALAHALPQREGPVSGEPWGNLPTEPPVPTLSGEALEGLETGELPREGDRISMKGRWIIDCGHNDFHSELHPITFMAFGHEEGAKTKAHVLTNPYRVTQLYGPEGTLEIDPKVTRGKPFPAGLEEAVGTLVKNSLFRAGASPLSLLVGIERTLPSATPFQVCAPAGGSRGALAAYSFMKRGGVTIAVKRPSGSQCATFTATVDPAKYKVFEPRPRTCVMPWPWLSQRIAEALGVAGVRSNEVERITVNATGGTFTITYGGETTGSINYNASATEVQEALDALAGLKNPGNVTVIGGPGGSGGGTPYTLIFGGELAEQAVTPVTTNRSGLTGGAKLATVVVLRPGGPLDLRRFILSEIEQQQKAALEGAGFFAGISRIEANMALNPLASCLDPLSAPALNPEKVQTLNNSQPFPYYGEVTLERR